MPMTVKFSFAGSVLCYQKRGIWTFVFPTDEVHPLNFSDDGGYTYSELRQEKMNREIAVSVDNPVMAHPNPHDSFPEILNMSSDEMHGTTGKKSNLMIKPKKIPGRELIIMTVPTGFTGPTTETDDNYWIEQVYPPLAYRPLNRKVAKQVTLIVELNQGRGLELSFRDTPSIPIGTYDFHDDTHVDLIFNNDCGGECKQHDDFSHYYDWVEDQVKIEGRPRQFNAGKDPHTYLKDGAELVSPYGNCDPAGSEPPPEP